MCLLVTVVVALGLCLVDPGPGLATETTAGSLSVSPHRAVAGHRVTFTGHVPPHRSRPVVLQRRHHHHWVNVHRKRSSHKGRFTFRIHARKTTTTYRVLAPRKTINGHTYRAVKTPRRTVKTISRHHAKRFLTNVSANGRYFRDQYGRPIMLRGDTSWGLVFNAGRWHQSTTTWQSDIRGYVNARAAEGFNTVYVAALGNTVNGGRYDTGATWDGVSPWVGGSTSSIGPHVGTLNNAYWNRVDYLIKTAKAAGVTVMLDIVYGQDIGDGGPGAMSANGEYPSDAKMTTYGRMLGNRYKQDRNVIWMIGGDYFGGADAKIALTLKAIRNAGGKQLISVENYDHSASYSSGLGNKFASWSTIYSYAPTYIWLEKAWAQNPTIPVVWIDGYYDQNSGSSNDLLYRQEVGWSLTSGSRGSMYGSEGVWNWNSDSLSVTKHPWPATRQMVAAWNAVSKLHHWYQLRPDIHSGQILTGDRGTKITDDEDTYTSPSNDYITGSLTPDGSLALIYLPRGGTAHVTWAHMAASGRKAMWLDPTNGALRSAPAGRTSYSSPSNNAAGQPDWYLVLRAS